MVMMLVLNVQGREDVATRQFGRPRADFSVSTEGMVCTSRGLCAYRFKDLGCLSGWITTCRGVHNTTQESALASYFDMPCVVETLRLTGSFPKS